MLIHLRRPRYGRLLIWIAVPILLFVVIGLAVYHYRRLHREESNPELMAELAVHKFSDPPPATDWPQWRGPNRDGVSMEAGLSTQWPKEGPKVVWEAKTGDGFASVAIAQNRAVTIFQDGKDEAVVCWDAATGKELWRHAYPCRYKNSYGNGPRSTPSIDGNHVYTVGARGMMFCLTLAEGKVLWSKDLLEEFSAAIPKWGVSFSPLVDGDRVFIMPGGAEGNSLAAIEKKSGHVLWRQHEDAASYSSPVAATFHGKKQILFLTAGRLVSVAPNTGSQLWDYDWPIQENCNIATPIVMDDFVFISTGYGKGCALLKIVKSGKEWQARLVYKNRNMRNHFSSSVRHKDHLFGFDDTNLVCLNLRTGEQTWHERGFDKGSVLLAGDQLIVYGANGILALADANSAKYVERSRFQFSQQGRSCWSVPVLANGMLYVRDQEKLVCLDVKGK